MAYELQGQTINQSYLAQTETPVKPETMQSIIENFDPLLGRLEILVGRAMTCADKIEGGRPPSAVTAEKAAPEPSHLIWAMQARRGRLSRAVDILETELSRIENGIA